MQHRLKHLVSKHNGGLFKKNHTPAVLLFARPCAVRTRSLTFVPPHFLPSQVVSLAGQADASVRNIPRQNVAASGRLGRHLLQPWTDVALTSEGPETKSNLLPSLVFLPPSFPPSLPPLVASFILRRRGAAPLNRSGSPPALCLRSVRTPSRAFCARVPFKVLEPPQRWPFASFPSLLTELITSSSSSSRQPAFICFQRPLTPPPNPFACPSPFTPRPTPASNLPHRSFRSFNPSPTGTSRCSCQKVGRKEEEEEDDDSSVALPNLPSARLFNDT